MKKLFILAIIAVVLTGLSGREAAAVPPQTSFVEPPTPVDGATIEDTSVEIEVSIKESALTDVIFDWDGTDYSLYDDSLVLMFNFDNVAALGENYTVAGDVVKDLSRWGNHGYLSDEALDPDKVPTWLSYGRYGGAFDFTGNGVDSGQSIHVPHSDSLNPYDSDFAIAVWILTRDDYDGDILRKGSTDTAGTWYKIEHSPTASDNKIGVNFNTDGTDATFASVAAYNDYQWHFVVAQRKGNQAELWIDGILDGTASVTGSISNTANLAVGSKDTQNDDFINSSLDEIRIYMRSFRQDEIQELYYTNLSKYAADGWTLYANQSDLINKTYTYQATAINDTPETASTEQRSVTVSTQGPVTFVPAGAVWKYDDTGTDLGTTWREASYDDSLWASGSAELGYGDGDETTTLSYGDDPANKYPCYYFRHTFNVPDASQVGSMKLRLVRDDGVVVYLNGAEIARSNMPGGTIEYTTFASTAVGGDDEYKWWEFDVDPAGLVDGENLLAVEIHQSSGTSTDISFNLELAEPEHIRKGPYLFYTGVNTEMKILWQMDVPQGCTLKWGTDPEHLRESVLTTEIGSDHQHEYVIGSNPDSQLIPGTKYYYKVTDAYGGTHTGSFTAAPATNADNVKFLLFGDTRADAGLVPYPYNGVSGAMNNFLAANPDYQTLTVHVGDWVCNDTEDDWQNMFFNRSLSNAIELHENMPINGCIGNHDTYVNGGVIYEKYYPYPYVGSFYWSFDYGPAHFAIVNQYVSYSPGSAQYNWLENDLQNSDSIWKFIVLHEPGYTAGGGNESVRNFIHPLCVAYDVDMVLAGHDHYYSRSVVDGVQHITSGGGGAPLKGVVWQDHTVAAESVYQFCEIEIQGDTVYFSALRLDQSVIDSFETTKPWPKASAPSPADGELNVALDAVLGWTAGAGAASHDIYLGTDLAAVTAADTSSPEYQTTQPGTTYGPLSLSPGITYYWRIDEFDGTRTYTGTVWSFTTVDNPQLAGNPSPANGATDISIETDLGWTAGAGAVSHDVYFGTEAAGLPLVSAAQADPNYDPGTLANNTTYYWRIDEFDGSTTHTGYVWSFITASAPGQASNPSPGDAATDIVINAVLSWTEGSDTTSHDVYFGTNPTPGVDELKGNQTGVTFNPVSMDYSTTYYWRIDEVGPGGTTSGAVWSFTTAPPPPPGQATNPSPSDGNTGVLVNEDLSWDAGEGAVSHDVYFGTSYTAVEEAVASVICPEYKGNQIGITFDPGQLEEGVTYYWRIDEVNVGGEKTKGVVWSFTTVLPPPPGQASSPTPADGATGVSIWSSLQWVTGSGATSHDVYFGNSPDLVTNATQASAEFKGNQTIPYYSPEQMDYSFTYYWRIDEVGLGGTTKGDTWSFMTAPDTDPPFIYYINVSGITAHEATISWTTDEPADSQVEFGLDTSYGSLVHDGNEVTSHSVTLTGLWPDTKYYYRVTSTDHAGNPATVEDPDTYFFTTLANTPPVAVDDSATTNEGTPVVIDVLVNDSDFDGDILTVESVTFDPAKATVVTDGETVTYTPLLAAPYIDTFTYTINDGYGGTAQATVTVDVREPYVDYVAYNEIAVLGTVTGSYADTQAKDASYEVIEEILDKPNKNAASLLEHKWLIDVPGTGPQSFHVNAYRDNYDTADDFVFAYSTDDSTYTDMLAVTKTADDGMYQTYALPDSISGTVYIRVSDTHHEIRELVTGQVHVDHMFIRCESAGGPVDNPPVVTITSPSDGATFGSGAVISFVGTAVDAEDGDLTSGLVWQSDIEGQIGTGGSFTTILSDGEHIITTSVTDSGSNIGSASISITVGDPPPAPPTGLAASAGDGQVNLDWDDSPEPDLAGYNVYRSETSGGPYSQVNGTLLTTSDYLDLDVVNGTTYFYVVSAVDTATPVPNESDNSNEASATPGSQQTVYVEGINMSLVPAGKNWKGAANVQISVYQANATVIGDWYLGSTGTTADTLLESGATGLTDTGGLAAVISIPVKAKSGEYFTFVVTDVILTDYIFDPGQGITENSIIVP